MPARSRKADTVPEICEDCFPDGWDGLTDDAYAPGCQHGSWTHPDRVPETEPRTMTKREAEVLTEGMDLGQDVVTF